MLITCVEPAVIVTSYKLTKSRNCNFLRIVFCVLKSYLVSLKSLEENVSGA